MRFLILGLVLFSPLGLAAQETRPVVIAHRGASGYLPEHTLPAKALAHGMGADFLEQDVVLTKDDVPVVLHDIYLDTVTDVARRFPGRARPDGRFYVLDFTLEEVKQLHVTERFNLKTGRPVFAGRFPAGLAEFRVSTLEEELGLIAGLNQSTGRKVGIYPELKHPMWHRKEGHDLSRIVLPILARHGYATKQDACWLQCFELTELRRVRAELNWKGRSVLLMEVSATGEDGTNYDELSTPAGLQGLGDVIDGIGPSISRVVKWTESGVQVSPLVAAAHSAKLAVHPYTIRKDELPKGCPSLDDLHAALFGKAKVDGVFSDFTDLTVGWIRAKN